MFIIEKLKHRKYQVALLVASIIYSISFIFWTDMPDGYYYYNLFHASNTNYMIALSFWIGQCWLRFVSDDFLLFKALGWVFCFSSILLPYFCFQEKTEWKFKLNYLSLGIFMFGCWSWKIYNPDSLTIFFLISVICSIHVKKPNCILNVSLVALLSALAVAARFPNICVLFCVNIYILLYNCRKSWNYTFLYMFLYTIISFALYKLLLFFLLENKDSYTVAESVNYVINNNSTHSLSILLHNYLYGIKENMKSLVLILISLFPLFVFAKKRGMQTIGVFFSCSLLLLVLVIRCYQWMHWMSIYAIISLLFIFIRVVKTKNYYHSVECVFISLVALVGIAGSDTGLTKLFNVMSPMVPVIMIWYQKEIRNSNLIKCYLLSTALFSACVFGHAVVLKFNYLSDFKDFRILMQKEQYELRKARLDDFHNYGLKNHVIFYGFEECHVMYAITKTKPMYDYSFFQYPENRYGIDKVIEAFENDSRCTVFDYSDSKYLEMKMDSVGSKKIEGAKSKIYQHN